MATDYPVFANMPYIMQVNIPAIQNFGSANPPDYVRFHLALHLHASRSEDEPAMSVHASVLITAT